MTATRHKLCSRLFATFGSHEKTSRNVDAVEITPRHAELVMDTSRRISSITAADTLKLNEIWY
jgi:hypothetical protein